MTLTLQLLDLSLTYEHSGTGAPHLLKRCSPVLPCPLLSEESTRLCLATQTAWFWVNYGSVALAAQTTGRAGLPLGQRRGRSSSSAAPVSTQSFLRGTVPAPVRLALLRHIPHPAGQESLRPRTPPHLSASPALRPATTAGSPVPAR